jgi:hypothetical protein
MDSSTGPKPRSHVFGYLDETGLLHSPPTDRFFGLGLVVIQNPRELHRRVIQLKNKQHFYEEFKFTDINHKNLPLYVSLVDIVFSTQNLRFNCYIVDKTKAKSNHPVRSYNGYAGYLVAHAIGQKDVGISEYITVLADGVSTNSIDDQFEKMVRERIKRVTRRNALFGICRIESHAVTEIQVCDVLVGAVAYAHKLSVGIVKGKTAKAKLVKHMQNKLNTYSLAQGVNLHLKNGVMFCITEK